MPFQKEFPKLDDPKFYLDFISRYARAGEHFFDMLECWCSFLGLSMPIIIGLFIFVMGIGHTGKMETIPFVHWVLIIASFLVLFRFLFHVEKERPRWHIARSYRDIARNDVYPLERAYRNANTVTETEMVMNHIRVFQKKFPTRRNALTALIYNQCLIARGEPKQKFQATVLDRLFPRCVAFLGNKSVIAH